MAAIFETTDASPSTNINKPTPSALRRDAQKEPRPEEEDEKKNHQTARNPPAEPARKTLVTQKKTAKKISKETTWLQKKKMAAIFSPVDVNFLAGPRTILIGRPMGVGVGKMTVPRKLRNWVSTNSMHTNVKSVE